MRYITEVSGYTKPVYIGDIFSVFSTDINRKCFATFYAIFAG